MRFERLVHLGGRQGLVAIIRTPHFLGLHPGIGRRATARIEEVANLYAFFHVLVDLVMQPAAEGAIDVGEYRYCMPHRFRLEYDQLVVLDRFHHLGAGTVAVLLGQVRLVDEVDQVTLQQVAAVAGDVSDDGALADRVPAIDLAFVDIFCGDAGKHARDSFANLLELGRVAGAPCLGGQERKAEHGANSHKNRFHRVIPLPCRLAGTSSHNCRLTASTNGRNSGSTAAIGS